MDIKELAKKLCDESGCHHKCKEIDECVVMEEAELLINQDKSNNFDVKSNNELVPKENELPFVLTNEDKVSVKVKQIEEMARILCISKICHEKKRANCIGLGDCPQSRDIAEALYNAGYRKQSVGEWIVTNENGCWYYDCPFCDDGYAQKAKLPPSNYCSNCGAKLSETKMKGGE